MIEFKDITLADKELIQSFTLNSQRHIATCRLPTFVVGHSYTRPSMPFWTVICCFAFMPVKSWPT